MKTILILEDDVIIVDLIFECIRKISNNTKVKITDTVDDAFRLYGSWKPDVFVCDNRVNGPRLGSELLRNLKGHPHNALKIFYSGDMFGHNMVAGYCHYVVGKDDVDGLKAALRASFT